MSMNKTDHLSDEEVFESMLDESSLAVDARAHLLQCPFCRSKKELLEGSLTRFEQTVRKSSPSPLRRPDLSAVYARRRREGGWQWYWKYGIPAGMAAVLALLFIAGTLLFREPQSEMAFLSDRETVEDEQLLAEVWKLEENAIPPLYLDMSGMRDADGGEPSGDDASLKGTKMNGASNPSVQNGTVS